MLPPQPNAPHVQTYFDRLIKDDLGGAPITCAHTGDKGKAIYAASDFKPGDSIWSERPFVAMQHEDNKDFIDACEHCFVSLISSEDCWERIEAANDGVADAATFQDFDATISLLQKQGGKSDDESYFSVYRLAKNKVQCVCGVLYCSETCKKAAYDEQHALLCTRSDTNDSPMGHFVNHTLVTNEIFQLAAKVIARIVMRFISTHDMAHAREAVDMFCKQPWWEVVTSEDDLEEGQTLEEYQDCFKGLLGQTLEHFLTGLRENLVTLAKNDELNGLSVDAVLETCSEVLTLDFFGAVVGMFEMNNISLEIDHPFHTIREALAEASMQAKDQLPPVLIKVKDALAKYAEKFEHDHGHDHEHHHGDGEECGGHDHGHGHDHAHDHGHDHSHDHAHDHHHYHGHDHGHDHDEDEEEDCCGGEDAFVGVEGTALFSGICTMNHSCDPNVTVIYMKDGTAQVYAVQEIKKGDELCISYIDVDQDVEDRQLTLREYQFTCHCPRCEEERHA